MTKIKHLKLNKLCRTFSYREIAVLAQFIKQEILAQGAVIFKEGDEDGRLFMVIAGEVGIKSGLLSKKEGYPLILKAGDFFGELSLFGAGPRKVSASAISDNTILFSLSRHDFNQLTSMEPFVAHKLLVEMIGVFSAKLKDSGPELNKLLGFLVQKPNQAAGADYKQ
jgi:CRP-like cAMP-binding protein